MVGDALGSQHRLHEGAADSTVGVREGADGLELGMREGRLRQLAAAILNQSQYLPWRPPSATNSSHLDLK
jgi:hypothetical protein